MISFDESLNKDFQTEKMDIIVHYFCEDSSHAILLTPNSWDTQLLVIFSIA